MALFKVRCTLSLIDYEMHCWERDAQTKQSLRLLSYSLCSPALLPQLCPYPICIVTATNDYKHSGFKTTCIYCPLELKVSILTGLS